MSRTNSSGSQAVAGVTDFMGSGKGAPSNSAGGGEALGAGFVVGTACCAAVGLVAYAVWRRQSGSAGGGGNSSSSNGRSGNFGRDSGRLKAPHDGSQPSNGNRHESGPQGFSEGDRGRAGQQALSGGRDQRYQDYQSRSGTRSGTHEGDMADLRAELSSTTRSLVATQGALLEMHVKRSNDRDDNNREMAVLRAELSNAARDLRAAQTSLMARSHDGTSGQGSGSRGLGSEASRVELLEAQLLEERTKSQDAAAREKSLQTQLTTANKEAADAQESLAALRAISTGSSGGVAVRGSSGGLADRPSSGLSDSGGAPMPAPANEHAERARSMFANSAGPQWEDVVVPKDAIELCCDAQGKLMKLGEGYSGDVYRARIHGSTLCACKVFPLHSLTSTANRHKYFIDECRLLWRMAHPNVVQFYGACVSEDQGYLLMELMSSDLGAALHNRREGGDNTNYSWPKKGARVALQIAAGLVYLHQHRIVHLDLKPKNVLLARDGTAKLADVGFSRVMKADVLSNLGDRLGTFDYCAPEVLLSQPASEKADIYSFGVLLWEICAGQVPSRRSMRPLQAPQECPEEIRDLQLACVRLNPTSRPSAAQIVRQFHQIRRANSQTASAPALATASSGDAAAAAAIAAVGAEGERAASAPLLSPEAAAPRHAANGHAAGGSGQLTLQRQHSVGEDVPEGPVQFLPLPVVPVPTPVFDTPFRIVTLPGSMGEGFQRSGGPRLPPLPEEEH